MAIEAVVEENEAEDDTIDEPAANVVEQAKGAAKVVADQVDAEEASDQGSPAVVSE